MRIAAHAVREFDKSDTDCDSAGSLCYYYKLNDTVGLKGYSDAKIAFYSYCVQRLLYEHDLAPDCWGFSEVDGHAAFFTEHCEDTEAWYKDYPTYQKNQEKLRKEICEVLGINPAYPRSYQSQATIENCYPHKDNFGNPCAYPWLDMHIGNVREKNGRLITIDVSHIPIKESSPLSQYQW